MTQLQKENDEVVANDYLPRNKLNQASSPDESFAKIELTTMYIIKKRERERERKKKTKFINKRSNHQQTN